MGLLQTKLGQLARTQFANFLLPVREPGQCKKENTEENPAQLKTHLKIWRQPKARITVNGIFIAHSVYGQPAKGAINFAHDTVNTKRNSHNQ